MVFDTYCKKKCIEGDNLFYIENFPGLDSIFDLLELSLRVSAFGISSRNIILDKADEIIKYNVSKQGKYNIGEVPRLDTKDVVFHLWNNEPESIEILPFNSEPNTVLETASLESNNTLPNPTCIKCNKPGVLCRTSYGVEQVLCDTHFAMFGSRKIDTKLTTASTLSASKESTTSLDEIKEVRKKIQECIKDIEEHKGE
jgi:hypothetical protein